MPATKFNDEVRQKIVSAIRAGNYVTVASRYAGIDPSTFYKWMRKGQQATKGAHRDFYEHVLQAESFAEVSAVAALQTEVKDNWRAALAYLERKFPKRWSTRRPINDDDSEIPIRETRHDDALGERLAHYQSVIEEIARFEQDAPEQGSPMASGGAAHSDGPEEPVDPP